MADENSAVVAEPEAEQTLKNFGDLGEVFDKVFPATAEKKEEAKPEPASEPAPVAAPEPAKPAAEVKPSAVEEELPDFLTGKKEEPVVPAAEPEPELPKPTGKESVGMKQIRTAYDNLKKKLAEKEASYTAQIEELKKVPVARPDSEAAIKQLEAQNQELSAAVERTAIEFHPAFRAEFVTKREQLVNDAHAILTEAKADPSQWDRAMALSGTARTDALEELYNDLPRSVSTELGATAREIRSLDSRKDAYLADRKGLQERLQQETLRQQREALQQHEKSTLEILGLAEKDLVEHMGMEVYKTSDNPQHKKWNESVERMKADARKILLETDDPSVMARAALLAPAAIQYRYLYHVMRDRWLESEARNKAIEKSEPTSDTRGEVSKAEDEKLSFADAVARQVFHK